MTDCIFCKIAQKEIPSYILYEDDNLLCFLDICPIREGHAQIIPKIHYETFDVLPSDLLFEIGALGQKLAVKMKALYKVSRVGFLFTGSDVAHAHAHIIPLFENTDITSKHYIVSNNDVEFSSDHLQASSETLERVRNLLKI